MHEAHAAGVLAQLRAEGLIGGWRDELYPVAAGFHAATYCLIERATAPFFGIKAYGVHACWLGLGMHTRAHVAAVCAAWKTTQPVARLLTRCRQTLQPPDMTVWAFAMTRYIFCMSL